MFEFSTDPELEAKLRDCGRGVSGAAGEGRDGVRGREVADPGVGPDRADAAGAPTLAEHRTRTCVRLSTTTPFAALEVATAASPLTPATTGITAGSSRAS